MTKVVCVSAKIYIEAEINDDVDLTGEWGEDTLRTEVIDGLDITVKDTTGKVKVGRVDVNNYESEIWKKEKGSEDD